MNDALLRAAGLGAITGLRSMAGLAAVSRELADRRRLGRHASRIEHWLADDTVASALTVMAAGEIVADKMPGVPARVSPMPLLARGIIGTLLGAVAAGHRQRPAGALIGGAAALVGSYAGWFFRAEVQRATMLPDAAAALAEDAIAVRGALELADGL